MRSLLGLVLLLGLVACDGGPPRLSARIDAGPGADAAAVAPPDASAPPDAGAPVDPGEIEACRAVDVLFVVDDSASMSDQQASLIASFPGFVRGMREQLGSAPSFHVGVATSDAYRANAPGCTAIGDLVTQTGGGGASNTSCGPFNSGGRFMSDAEPDLSARFACAAQVGTGGDDDERVMRALLDAVSPARNAPGACNAGFVRPDSLLVIVLISDEDDVRDGCTDESGFERCESYGSGGLPDDWFAEISEHRDPASVVVLSLIGRRAGNPCGAVVASRLLGFARRFGDNGYVGDVCAESYDTFFREALPVIGDACVNLI